MGELLFWVGEDKMTFGSDYNIWEPEVAGRGPRGLGLPAEGHDSTTTRVSGVDGKKKILGLNAAKLYDIEVPGRVPAVRGRRHARRPDDAELVEDGRWPRHDRHLRTPRSTDLHGGRGVGGAAHRARPRARHRRREPGLRRACSVSDDGVAHVRAAPAHLLLRPELRVPHGRRRVGRRVRRCRAWSTSTSSCIDHFASDAINSGVAARAGFVVVDGRHRAWARPSTSSTTCVVTSPSGR